MTLNEKQKWVEAVEKQMWFEVIEAILDDFADRHPEIVLESFMGCSLDELPSGSYYKDGDSIVFYCCRSK